ncbi:hypothetical protein BJG89_08955 [Staphylococcus nepalensis]|uniref:hypothetical protein n=1 Tax=Staphylococcus nepalensis TaxID=214473 RepID=UPI000BC363E3|nr:hypothetical protein [Staphylococcus nepalensis]ATH60398.1 hypothetical protein BJD96_08850 [Staphylococcus nepalensis]ATH61488.1 hypothetical protein BJD96_14245 [Staphylococcus nepalensis]ATH65447.1 hypothetical protein BJG89_08955 [Staphylococcus nepalensis]
MVKIKQKKTMNLPQLIEWGFNNPNLVKGKLFLTKEHDEYSPYVQFSVDGYGVRTSQSISNDDTFKVEVEEEITEDTVIDEMLTIYKNGVTHITNDKSLNYLDKTNLKSAYTMGDDLRLILIWRDGKLVE